MKDQFVTYEIAKRLKELGFNERCFAMYNAKTVYFYPSANAGPIDQIRTFENSEDITSAPLWQQVIDWLRRKGIQVYERTFTASENYTKTEAKFLVKQVGRLTETEPLNLETCILKALELIK